MLTAFAVVIHHINRKSALEKLDARMHTYALGIAVSLDEVHSDLHRMLLIFWIVILPALVIAGMSAYLISKSAFRPNTRRVATAREINATSLDRRLQLPADQGSGLGLFIVREFVSMHKGKITVESASVEGARLLVELPVSPE